MAEAGGEVPASRLEGDGEVATEAGPELEEYAASSSFWPDFLSIYEEKKSIEG